MTASVRDQPVSVRFEHLLKVIGSRRFLTMSGNNNEVPFFICDFDPSQSDEMAQVQRQLVNRLAQSGVRVLEIDLYDLSVELMKADGDWDWYVAQEATLPKAKLLEDLQSILDVEHVIVPAIAQRMAEHEFDVAFLSGVGEVFPFIRSHNILNNLQKVAKRSPTVMFFPGSYRHTLENGAALVLFDRLQDDKYYRAYNIYDYQA